MSKVEELRFLSGSLESAEEFNTLYEEMLKECRANGDLDTARAMQKILFHQAAFLMNQWLREDARMKRCEQSGQVQ